MARRIVVLRLVLVSGSLALRVAPTSRRVWGLGGGRYRLLEMRLKLKAPVVRVEEVQSSRW